LKLVQLIADNSWNETPDVDYDTMLTPEGLDEIAEYADGVGPWMNFIVVDNGEGNEPEFTDFVQLAHKRGLAVHPYTFRADSLPSYASDLEELFEIFLLDLGVDGVFTDFPDRGVTFIATHPELH
jgi:glycerophosphoryl diester phosphodiesterase